jgi:enterobactin synthetase component D
MTFILSEGPVEAAALAGIVIYSCEYDPARYDESCFDRLGIERPPFLDRAVRSRRAEYLAGRYCATCCLSTIGIGPRAIGTGPLRQPLFPPPSIGSISHTGRRACAAVAPDARALVGIDVQERIGAEAAAEIASSLATAEELAMLERVFGDRAVTVAFSIRETFFKAVSPRIGRYFGFEEVAVTAVSDGARDVELTVVRGVSDELSAGTRVQVRLAWLDEQTLLSVLTREADA